MWIYLKTKDGKEYFSKDFIITENDIVLYDAKDLKTGQSVGTIVIKEGEWETFLVKSKPYRGHFPPGV